MSIISVADRELDFCCVFNFVFSQTFSEFGPLLSTVIAKKKDSKKPGMFAKISRTLIVISNINFSHIPSTKLPISSPF